MSYYTGIKFYSRRFVRRLRLNDYYMRHGRYVYRLDPGTNVIWRCPVETAYELDPLTGEFGVGWHEAGIDIYSGRNK